MKLPRRRFLRLAGDAASLLAVSGIATAQTYPSRPVRIIVGYAAGGSTDIAARLMGQWLSERLGRPFIIENRTGFAGNIATKAVVDAPPDGYTLLLDVDSNAINATLYDELNFNYIRDIAPVAGIIRFPFVMVVSPSYPAATVPEFIAYAKANLGQVNMASAGVGSGNHLRGELFKIMAGVNMFHVPYRGEAPALADMLGGQVQVIFSTMPGTLEYITSGRLRPLAVTTATRSEALPNIPTMANSCRVTMQWGGMASAYPGTRPPRSSTSSTRRSTLASQIPNSRRGLPTWARQCSPVHPPNTASSSRSKPRSGPR